MTLVPQKRGLSLMQPATSPPSLKFGPYLLDARAGELRKNGAKIRLQEKPLRVLAALAEQQGQLVTREDLKKRLWPDDTFVDFETGLNTAVSKLRDALSDRSEKPRFIETIPRRGYRFLSPVEIVPSNGRHALEASPGSGVRPLAEPSSQPVGEGLHVPEPSPSVELEKNETLLTRSHSTAPNFWFRAAVAACVALVVFTIWWLTPLPEPRILNIYPVTSTGRQDFLVKPATDGVRIFYVQRAGDHYDLMESSINGGDAQKMAAPFPNTLIWDVSPDGSQYLMTSFAHRGEPSPLWSWPAIGGAPVKLDDLVSGSATWSSDGKMIVYHAGHDLWVANADGTGKLKVRTFQDEPDSPMWSPDGHHIRFTLNDPERNTRSIWQISPNGSDLTPVLPNWQACCGTWTPDGRYFVFVDTSEKVSRLWALREKGDWLRRSPRGPFLLASEANNSWSPLVGKDGKNVYFYGISAQSDIERLDVKSGRFTSFLPELHAAMPSFSRDGQWVSHVQLNTSLLWRSRADGRELQQIAAPGLAIAFPRWSPDGRMLVFAGTRPREPVNAYSIPIDGGHPEPIVPGVEGLSDPDWSPDGSSIVVTRIIPASLNAEADSMVAIVDLKSHQIRNLEGSKHLSGPRWSPDGRFLAAIEGTTHQVEVYDLNSKQWRVLAQGHFIGMPAWSRDGAYLYYQDLLAAGEPLFRVNVASGQIGRVAAFQDVLDGGVHRCAFLELTPDGDPLIGFQRGDADIYGAVLSLP
jgi:Tol biopolymer transport system component/DNA-binding winged helix-turn-helix (wHTH) protein